MATPWFSVATFFKGVSEVHGAVDNPKIVEMFRVSGHPEVQDDETPWCAAFVGTCLRLSGYQSSGSLGARSYQNFGQDLRKTPQRGCIVVFSRGDPKAQTGHVALFDRDDGDHIVVLGGNQSDAVTSARYPKNRVLSYRMPVETAPLPTDTTLPNILTIDPNNAPPHLLAVASNFGARSLPQREARATEALSDGATGPRVQALQQTLTSLGFQLGEIDGEFGPLTASAVSRFQGVHSLPVTGTADAETLRVLGLEAPATSGPAPFHLPFPLPMPGSIGLGQGGPGGGTMQPQDILKTVFEVVLARQGQGQAQGGGAPGAHGLDAAQVLQAVLGALAGRASASDTIPSPAVGAAPAHTGLDASQLLHAVLGAFTGSIAAPAADGTKATPTVPVLSPIDKLLGGEALAGKKTPLAILAYVILSILQSTNIAGTFGGDTATATGQILTTLIASFGGLGVLGKVDRVVQLLGVIAAKRPR